MGRSPGALSWGGRRKIGETVSRVGKDMGERTNEKGGTRRG